jgi:hypothetical protein
MVVQFLAVLTRLVLSDFLSTGGVDATMFTVSRDILWRELFCCELTFAALLCAASLSTLSHERNMRREKILARLKESRNHTNACG